MNFLVKKKFSQKNCSSKKIVCQKEFKKKFKLKKNLGVNKFWWKKLSVRKCSVKKIVGQKKIFDQKIFSEKNFGRTKYLVKKKFGWK